MTVNSIILNSARSFKWFNFLINIFDTTGNLIHFSQSSKHINKNIHFLIKQNLIEHFITNLLLTKSQIPNSQLKQEDDIWS